MEEQVIEQDQEVVETPVETGDEAEKAGEEAAPEKKEEPVKEPEGEKKETPAWAKKRFDELTRKRVEEERRRYEAEKEAAYLKGQLDAMKGGNQPDAEVDAAPRPEKFDTYDEFVGAKARWEARQEMKAERERVKSEQEKEVSQRTEGERRERAMKQAMEARKKFEDFDDVLSNPDLPQFSKSVAEVIHDSDIGAEIAYYLGKNTEEAEKIASLSPLAAAREIGKIELKILNPPKTEPKRITSAGAPVSTVGEKGNVTVDPSKMTDAEWYAHYKKEQEAKRTKKTA